MQEPVRGSLEYWFFWIPEHMFDFALFSSLFYLNVGLSLVVICAYETGCIFLLYFLEGLIGFPLPDSSMIASNVKKNNNSTTLVGYAYFEILFFHIYLFSVRTSNGRKHEFYCLQCLEDTKERIKKMFNKVELSISSYDTARVAMIPSPTTPHSPFFPQCLNWLLDNQLLDGSWGLPGRHPLLMNDALLSTLACILALKQWGIGEDQMNKGIFLFVFS